MALTRNEMARLMEKDDWNLNEKKDMDEVMDYLKVIETYRDYAPPLALEYDNDARTKLEFFNSNQNQIKNKDMLEFISKYNKSQKVPNLVSENNLSLTRRQKINGYTNAAVLIFVVLNFGLLLSFLLLILK